MSRKRILGIATAGLFGLAALGWYQSTLQTGNRAGGTGGDATTCPESVTDPKPWRTLHVATDGNDEADGSLDAPFATLDRARAAARDLGSTWKGDVVVAIRGGTYHLDKALTFEPADSGKSCHRLIFQPHEAEDVTIAGGPAVTGWSGPDDSGIYATTTVPQVAFRHLTVDGRRATRARYPNGDDFLTIAAWDDPAPYTVCPKKKMGRRLGLGDDDAALFDQIPAQYRADLEIFAERRTGSSVLRIDKVGKPNDHGSGVRYVTPKSPERGRMFGDPVGCMWQEDGLAYRFENSIGLLDAPDEWFLDTSTEQYTLYYRPRDGETPDESTVIAPVLASLVRFEGTDHKRVRDITIRGLTFTGTTWTLPNREGFVSLYPGVDYRDDDGWWDTKVHPAAIHLEGTERITLERNVLRSLGGAGIALYDHTRDSVVDGNAILELAGIGILVDGEGFVGRITLDAKMPTPGPGDARSDGDHITNNRVQGFGLDYFASGGIAAAYPWDLAIEHNEVSDGGGPGIAIGWYGLWTACHSINKGKALPKDECERANGRNRIVANSVSSVGQIIDDVGGIYSLGHQSPTDSLKNGLEIRQNHVFNMHRPAQWTLQLAPFASLYLDGDTSFTTILDNIFEQPTGPYPSDMAPIFLNPDKLTSKPPHDLRWIVDGAGKPPGDNVTDPTLKPDVRDAAGLSPGYETMPSLG